MRSPSIIPLTAILPAFNIWSVAAKTWRMAFRDTVPGNAVVVFHLVAQDNEAYNNTYE